jgi:hypothetical protein
MRRQLALVRARMPMKAGVKIPRAKTVVRIAMYSWFSFLARQPCAALSHSQGLSVVCRSVGAVMRS